MRDEPLRMPDGTPETMDADDTLSPVDLPGRRTIGGHPLGWAAGAIYLAAAFLLLTNAATLSGWAAELPPSGWSARLVDLTGRWEATTARLGAPRAAMHAWWKAAQAARFGNERAE